MTDEDALYAAIDARPEDPLPRLILADYLEERGDIRAEGYREMARLRVCAREYRFDGDVYYKLCEESNIYCWSGAFVRDGHLLEFALPDEWIKHTDHENGPHWNNWASGWRIRSTRREVEDDAAVGYHKWQESLLANSPVEKATNHY